MRGRRLRADWKQRKEQEDESKGWLESEERRRDANQNSTTFYSLNSLKLATFGSGLAIPTTQKEGRKEQHISSTATSARYRGP